MSGSEPLKSEPESNSCRWKTDKKRPKRKRSILPSKPTLQRPAMQAVY
jgi:hypothetical protein